MSTEEFEILTGQLQNLIDSNDSIGSDISELIDIMLNIVNGIEIIKNVAVFIFIAIIVRYCFKFLWDIIFKYV